jgi:hypothetical protein
MTSVSRGDDVYQSFLESKQITNSESYVLQDSFRGYVKHCFKPQKVTLGYPKDDRRVIDPVETDNFCKVPESELIENIDSKNTTAKVVSADHNYNSLFLYYAFDIELPNGKQMTVFNSEKGITDLSQSQLQTLLEQKRLTMSVNEDEIILHTSTRDISVREKDISREGTTNFKILVEYLAGSQSWVSGKVVDIRTVDESENSVAIVIQTEFGFKLELLVQSLSSSENKLTMLSELLLGQSNDPLLITDEEVSLKPLNECDLDKQDGIIGKSWLVKYPVSSFGERKDTLVYNLIQEANKKFR